MDRARVAAFYRAKGYTVREAMLATGHSGNSHRVPLLCEGPLGNLAVFFGDHDGIDGPEMGGARRVAKDLGATPVLAAPAFTNVQRNTAAELGVVLIDHDAIAPEAAPALPTTRRAWPEAAMAARATDDIFAEHPWPESGRPGGRDGMHAKTFEVEDLLRDLGSQPVRSASPPAAARAPPTPVVAEPQAANEPRTRTAAATKFAWLGLPTQSTATEAIRIEVDRTDDGLEEGAEFSESLPVHETVDAPTESIHDGWRRKAAVRIWVRRGLWLGAIVGVVYAFSQWYGQ